MLFPYIKQNGHYAVLSEVSNPVTSSAKFTSTSSAVGSSKDIMATSHVNERIFRKLRPGQANPLVVLADQAIKASKTGPGIAVMPLIVSVIDTALGKALQSM